MLFRSGKFLGEFTGEDKILVIYKTGDYQLYNYDLGTHFGNNILAIEKFDPGKILSVVYYDGEHEFYYVKRFEIEETLNKLICFIGEGDKNKLVSVTWVRYPRLELEFGGKNIDRENEIIEVAEFIGIKSWKAKGKRLTHFHVENIKELEPVIKDEHESTSDQQVTDNQQAHFDDIPFEVQRPGEEDANQMTLF